MIFPAEVCVLWICFAYLELSNFTGQGRDLDNTWAGEKNCAFICHGCCWKKDWAGFLSYYVKLGSVLNGLAAGFNLYTGISALPTRF